jgi:hypothetical protein
VLSPSGFAASAVTAAVGLGAVFAIAHGAAAQNAVRDTHPNADDYRGGWRSDAGDPHVYQFSIRGAAVRGIYCTRCSDATTLAFVDGTLDTNGIAFTVTHVKADGGTAYRDEAAAKFVRGTLVVTGTSAANGGKFERTLHKDPRGPDPLPIPVTVLPPGPPVPALPRPAASLPPAPYVQPAPWRQLSDSDVVGVWLGFGVGMDKQFFIFRKVGDQLRGMVCGRCDNPYTMAALDDVEIRGDTLTFNILHEDWGPGTLPFHNQAVGHVAKNEMRLTFQQDNQPPRANGATFAASLLGPIAIDATQGND